MADETIVSAPASDPLGLSTAYSAERNCEEIEAALRQHFAAGGRVGFSLAKRVRDMALVGAIREAVETGRGRLPSGYGSLRLVRMGVGVSRTLPGGQVVRTNVPRSRLRYFMGIEVMKLLGYGENYRYKRKRPIKG